MSEANISEMLSPPASTGAPEESSVFAQRSSVFKARLERHQQLEKAQEIRDSLLQIARKIEAPAKKLALNLTNYLLLRGISDSENGEPIVAAFDRDTFGHPQTLLKAFCLQYKEYKHDVAQQNEFALLIKDIERLANALNEHTGAAWREYTRGLRAQWEVDQKLFSSLVHLDEERKKQQHYSDLVADFTIRSLGLPKTAEEFAAVTDLHEQLCQQRESLRLDVPEEVNMFLKAVAGQGATLDMLTPDVLNWLANEDDKSRYRIKRL